jgi:hypothetical protein
MTHIHPAVRRTAMLRTAALIASAALLMPACVPPVPRDPSTGKVVLDPNRVRHRAGTPYFCFTAVGETVESDHCYPTIEDFCIGGMNELKGQGASITSPCKSVDAVSCFDRAHTSWGAPSCHASMTDCEAAAKSDGDAYGGQNEVSACQTFDKTFQAK